MQPVLTLTNIRLSVVSDAKVGLEDLSALEIGQVVPLG